MEQAMKVTWVDSGREPQCAPDPAYPAGKDLDLSDGQRSCVAMLPYPAKRCGYYVVECPKCGLSIACTTAGRADDPRSLRMPCKETLQ
jgi:hypothetical protein